MPQAKTLVWFRQDLRVRDNPALQAAADRGKVIPIYVLDDEACGDRAMGEASRWWLHHSLKSLNQSLRRKLLLFKGPAESLVPKIAKELEVDAVVWNRCYEPWRIHRDKKIKQALRDADVDVDSFNGSLLWEPWTIKNQSGAPYKVFTPYYRKGCLKQDSPRQPLAKPRSLVVAEVTVEGAVELDALALLPKIKWDSEFGQEWQPGEEGASNRLRHFIRHALNQYQDKRNIPSEPGTSQLSPHLHFGELSPNQAWHAALSAHDGDMGSTQLDTFLSELGWREFSYYLLFHFPNLPERNFQEKFDQFAWKKSKKDLTAWQKGQTGIPIVDAGMRQLWTIGYMHNRVRMIVGSFLVKNLLLHWHHGERWFWDCLCDADLASNSASWQWVAGSGADAAPYFRIFNPVSQGEKFDTEGEYVKEWVPELRNLPKKFIHKPWEASESMLGDAGIKLGKNYPKPIVDLKESRQRALDAFSKIKKSIP